MNTKIIMPILLFASCSAPSQTQYHISTVAFYNVENFFDTNNDPLTFDDDRTPDGKDQWSEARYFRKVEHLSKVLSEIGKEETGTSPDIIGLCEVENHAVLEDLINHPNLKDKNYGIIHFDSPDERGIDVGLLYKKTAFLPTSFSSIRLLLLDITGERDYTRDQLVVGGLLDGEPIHILVNHWPSRSGGEAASKPGRLAAAKLNEHIIDSIRRIDFDAKIISMGDLNDDPIDDALKKVLKTFGYKEDLIAGSLFNPMEALYKMGIGSLAYRDKWNLFDQIIFTENWVNHIAGGYGYWKAGVFNKSYLVTELGQYKGYPFRTYAGGNYTGGYSDHFPVFVYLIKEAASQPLSQKEGN